MIRGGGKNCSQDCRSAQLNFSLEQALSLKVVSGNFEAFKDNYFCESLTPFK